MDLITAIGLIASIISIIGALHNVIKTVSQSNLLRLRSGNSQKSQPSAPSSPQVSSASQYYQPINPVQKSSFLSFSGMNPYIEFIYIIAAGVTSAALAISSGLTPRNSKAPDIGSVLITLFFLAVLAFSCSIGYSVGKSAIRRRQIFDAGGIYALVSMIFATIPFYFFEFVIKSSLSIPTGGFVIRDIATAFDTALFVPGIFVYIVIIVVGLITFRNSPQY